MESLAWGCQCSELIHSEQLAGNNVLPDFHSVPREIENITSAIKPRPLSGRFFSQLSKEMG